MGNKCDLSKNREVVFDTVEQYRLNKQFLEYYETSAKNGINIEKVFKLLSGEIVKKINQNKISFTNLSGSKIIGIQKNAFKQQTCHLCGS